LNQPKGRLKKSTGDFFLILQDEIQGGLAESRAFILALFQIELEPLHQGGRGVVIGSPEAGDNCLGTCNPE
jgi:hypothetical protein